MKRLMMHTLIAALVLFVEAGMCAGPCLAVPVVPDNGSGTADMPIHLPYVSLDPLFIIDGLPPGDNILIRAVHTTPATTVEQAGGSLGGTQSAGIGTTLQFDMLGQGGLAGFNRFIVIPLSGDVASFPAPGAGYEVHAAPRTPGNPVQSFDTVMFRLFGQVTGDPDFDLLRVVAGTDFGLPSPGHTTLTQDGGNWQIDSFFDITYRIDFIGAPGSQLLAGTSGSTTGTTRLEATPEPATLLLLGSGAAALLGVLRRRRMT